MGLDMYLTKKTYVKQWDHQKPEDRFEVSVQKGGLPYPAIKPERVSYVEEEVAYWRKANAVHAWFVANVQDGRDECQETSVSRERLRNLLETVEAILVSTKVIPGDVHVGTTVDRHGVHENYKPGQIIEDTTVAETLLPTQSGFFFGGTDYDEFYVQDLQYTRDTIREILSEDDGELYYRASW